jgi:hypothetical protein
LDRGIFLTAPSIDDSKRKTEDEFWREFYAVRPQIIGALLNGVVTALTNVSIIVMERKPRMADFAVWCEGAAPAFGWKPGEFLAAYEDNRTAASNLALQSLLAESVQKLAPWTGTATALLEELEEQFEVETDGRIRIKPKPKDWPSAPNALSGMLRKIQPNLRKVGIDVSFDRGKDKKRTKQISLSRIDSTQSEDGQKNPSTSTAPSAAANYPTNPSLFTNGVADDGIAAKEPHRPASSAAASEKPQENQGIFHASDDADDADDGLPLLSDGDPSQKNGAFPHPPGYCPTCGSFNQVYGPDGRAACLNCHPPDKTADGMLVYPAGACARCGGFQLRFDGAGAAVCARCDGDRVLAHASAKPIAKPEEPR